MRTFLVALVLALPLGCAHQEQPLASTEPPQAPPPAVAQAKPPSPTTCGVARVHFAFDSDALTNDDRSALDQLANCLDAHQRLQVRIEGNTDEIGTVAYNHDLGRRRADAVLVYLETRGVATQQLQTVSFGETQPICIAEDADCRALNRRTAIRPLCTL